MEIIAASKKTDAILMITLEWPNGTPEPTPENAERFKQSIDVRKFKGFSPGLYNIRLSVDSDGRLLDRVIQKAEGGK